MRETFLQEGKGERMTQNHEEGVAKHGKMLPATQERYSLEPFFHWRRQRDNQRDKIERTAARHIGHTKKTGTTEAYSV